MVHKSDVTGLPGRPPQRSRGFLRRWLRSRRVRVQDESMVPALVPGDRLLVDLRAYRSEDPRPGQIVLLTDPEDPRRWLIKRVHEVRQDISGELWILVQGDNLFRSRDSRQFGPLPRDCLRGRAWFRYAPRERAGPLDPP
jgi:inner membrane protease subunit 1